MSFLDYLLGHRRRSAAVAKERLQLILAHERRDGATPDFLPALKEELLAVIGKYVPVDRDNIKVQLDRQGNYEVLELNIIFPDKG